jgi:hypothetical protein
MAEEICSEAVGGGSSEGGSELKELCVVTISPRENGMTLERKRRGRSTRAASGREPTTELPTVLLRGPGAGGGAWG